MILTSGTTGTPKGAARSQGARSSPPRRCSRRSRCGARDDVIAAPMFHAWGFAHYILGLAMSSTLVLRRRFDAEVTLRASRGTGRARSWSSR